MKETYQITVNRPAGASVKEMREYIREAVEMWGKQYHPEDPLFGLKSPTVKRLPTEDRK